jgi:FtsH-binding integral membrane protein
MNEQYLDQSLALNLEGEGVNRYVAKVFGWMFLGLGVTALSTFAIFYGIAVSEAFAAFLNQIFSVILIVFMLELLLVGYISVRVTKMKTSTAIAAYLIYAALNGLTVGTVAVLQAGSGVVSAFGITAVSFGVMAAYGLLTKKDLTKIGNLLRMGLIGLILVSVVNIFVASGPLDFVICIAGLVIFLGLTARHTQEIKLFYAQTAGRDKHMADNLAIVGALMLYLSFINLFLFILRLMGGRR